MLIGVSASCRISYSIVRYLYVSIPRLGNRELIFLLSFTFSSEEFPLPFGTWDRLRYFIVALPEPSI